jgi:chaperonin GroES
MSKNKPGIEPTGHHVLVKPDVVREKTSGGIYIPDEARQNEQRGATKGILVAIGPTAWVDLANGKPWAKVNDYVSYARHAGINMKGSDDEDYTLLNDQDILAILKK